MRFMIEIEIEGFPAEATLEQKAVLTLQALTENPDCPVAVHVVSGVGEETVHPQEFLKDQRTQAYAAYMDGGFEDPTLTQIGTLPPDDAAAMRRIKAFYTVKGFRPVMEKEREVELIVE